MIDIASQLNAIHRKVETLPAADGAGERVRDLMQRGYGSPIEDVWHAVTQPNRVSADQLAATTEVSLAQFAPDLATREPSNLVAEVPGSGAPAPRPSPIAGTCARRSITSTSASRCR